MTYFFSFQSLGNNEVDTETLEISPFLNNLKTFILASNVNIKSAEGKANIHKSIVFDIQSVTVGVVGYLTPENSMLDSFGQVEYVDEVLAITEEVEKLQASKVNIIIALGHASLDKEREIAKEVVGIDMVIAGNKNSFDWNDETASNHQSIVVTQQSGKQVPIIPSTAYNKYLGSVKAKFDFNGELLEYNVDPILLDSSVPQDTTSLEIVKSYHSDIVSRNTEVIGNTSVVLDSDSCNTEECNFGNLVTDAIMYYYATRFDGDRWTDAPIAVIHSAALFNSIAPPNRPADVTRGDLLSALSLETNLVAVTMNGVVLKELLEHSVRAHEIEGSAGMFLQISGIRAVYDLKQQPGSRLMSAVVRCWECFVPEFYEIEEGRNYKVLMPEVLTEGRHGYSFLTGLPKVSLGYDAVTCTEEYIKLRSPLYPEVAGRIVFQHYSSASALSSSLLLVAFISFSLIKLP